MWLKFSFKRAVRILETKNGGVLLSNLNGVETRLNQNILLTFERAVRREYVT